MVSVCVQTYQHVNYIKSCLDGILMQQTTFPFEIILGEDESDDGTREICMDYANKYPDKIRLFLRTRKDVIYINGQATGRYNIMENLKACSGKYIALCEGDDYWTDPLKLQKQIDFLETNSDYVICFHPCHVFHEAIQKMHIQPIEKIDYIYSIRNLLSYWTISTASIVLRRDDDLVFPDWFKKVASGDIALVMLYFEKGKFKLLKEYMSVYRLNGKGVSESHKNYKMIHYRAKLYAYLNEHFNYKYEKEIYDALNYIYIQFSQENPIKSKKSNFFKKLKKKFKRMLHG